MRSFAFQLLYAALIAMGASLAAHAHTFCAGSEPAIQAALDAASDGGANDNENNTIRIVIGTYDTADNNNAEFLYVNRTTARVLDINGGYNSDCSVITENPALTILDGGGATRVFESKSASGDVSLRFLTFQNGSTDTNDYGAGLLMNCCVGDNGPVIVDQNIIRDNHATSGSGGFQIYLGGSGTLQFENNLVVGNSAGAGNGAGEISADGGGVNIINNTFTQNTVTNMPESKIGGLGFDFSTATSPPPDTMSNNIFWGNSGYDLQTSAVLVDNDVGSNFGAPDPTSILIVSVDPQFSSSTDFHLLPTSPLLGMGTLTPAGGLPTIDVEGHSRASLTNTVDIGAYERGNEIFKDGYED
jgi:FlaG/FlaF family flagellin (archaellin)